MVTTAANAVFLDTGVLVHASATSSPFFQRERDVLRRVEKTGTAARKAAKCCASSWPW